MCEERRHFYSAIIDRLGWYEGMIVYYNNVCRALGEFFPEIIDLVVNQYRFRQQIDLMVEKVLTLRAATINRFYLLTEAEYGKKTLVITVTAKGVDNNGFVLGETYGTVSFEVRKESMKMGNQTKYFCGHCIARALIDKKIEMSDDCQSRRGVVCAMCSRKGEPDNEFFAYPGMERLLDNDNATA